MTVFASSDKPCVLLIENDAKMIDSLTFVLEQKFDVQVANDRSSAAQLLREMDQSPRLALVDLGLPPDTGRPTEGFNIIVDLLAHDERMKILILSGQTDRVHTRHALTLGAMGSITKPCDPGLLLKHLKQQLSLCDAEEKRADKGRRIIGNSPAMRALEQQIQQFAVISFPILLEGESGTGKNLIAAELHRRSPWANNTYTTIQCATLSHNQIEVALFGHNDDIAITNTLSNQPGLLSKVHHGTLVLDEISSLPLSLQKRLLQVIEEESTLPEAQNAPSTRPRIIAISRKNLGAAVRAGDFREDLYHCLGILNIKAPPLRERSDDRDVLMDYFRKVYAASVATFIFDKNAMDAWNTYPFPGNVRELRNIVIRLGTQHPDQIITAAELENEFEPGMEEEYDTQSTAEIMLADQARMEHGIFDLETRLIEMERNYIRMARKLADGNISKAAQFLNLNRTTLYSRLQRLDMSQ